MTTINDLFVPVEILEIITEKLDKFCLTLLSKYHRSRYFSKNGIWLCSSKDHIRNKKIKRYLNSPDLHKYRLVLKIDLGIRLNNKILSNLSINKIIFDRTYGENITTLKKRFPDTDFDGYVYKTWDSPMDEIVEILEKNPNIGYSNSFIDHKNEENLYSISKKIFLCYKGPQTEIREKIIIAEIRQLIPGVVYPNLEKLFAYDGSGLVAQLPNLKRVEFIGMFEDMIKILERYPTVTDIKKSKITFGKLPTENYYKLSHLETTFRFGKEIDIKGLIALENKYPIRTKSLYLYMHNLSDPDIISALEWFKVEIQMAGHDALYFHELVRTILLYVEKNKKLSRPKRLKFRYSLIRKDLIDLSSYIFDIYEKSNVYIDIWPNLGEIPEEKRKIFRKIEDDLLTEKIRMRYVS